MKKPNLLLLGVLFCAFALNSNAQSVTSDYETYWDFPTMCDGEFYWVSGMVNGHRVDHFNPKTGVLEWYKFTVKSDELVWLKNGEVFSVNFYHKYDFDPAEPIRTYRFNLRGNLGSHILVTKILLWDGSTWVQIKNTAKCL